MPDSRLTIAANDTRLALDTVLCPVCEGSRRITYGDVYTNHATHTRYVGWETGREIPCGCTQLVPIKGEAS